MKDNIWFLLKVAAIVFIISLVVMSFDDYARHALGWTWTGGENSAVRSAILALFAAFGAWLALSRSKDSSPDGHRSRPTGAMGNSTVRSPELKKKIAAVKAKIEILKSGGGPTAPNQDARKSGSSVGSGSSGQTASETDLKSAVELLLNAARDVEGQSPDTLNKRIKAIQAKFEQLKNG
jgi:hypothetical protein